jgi:hypothetical protein
MNENKFFMHQIKRTNGMITDMPGTVLAPFSETWIAPVEEQGGESVGEISN